mgnify:CR=1 FL=1
MVNRGRKVLGPLGAVGRVGGNPVRGSDHAPPLYTSPGKKCCLQRTPVIPAGRDVGVGDLEDLRRASEFPGDHHQCSLQAAGLVKIFQQGGKLVDEETKQVAFDNEKGLNALKLTRRFVTEGGQNLLDWDQSRQQFGAGRTGFIFSTPAHVQTVEGLVGDRFELKTATFPQEDKENGGVPTGGNSAVILTQDEAKQQAAWKYLKFITGPKAQDMIVRITGYLPTNKKATGPDYLEAYYVEHPNVKTASLQADRSMPWAGYPGGDSVRIWRNQRDIIGAVMRGEVTPEDGLKQIVNETNSLMN